MKIKITLIDGVARATDADTGAALDWVNEVAIDLQSDARPVVWLGILDAEVALTLGKPAPATP